ncbi:MAG: redox-regulated ATPase YchF [Deltaproteobacteria bacterium]|nr:redox-regulated ATPase YchF [Deltaproteobacteria bacterium]
MKLGIVGLPQCGKKTIFNALTGARGSKSDDSPARKDTKMATVMVFDERVEFLSNIYHPKKTTFARVEYLLPSEIHGTPADKSRAGLWNQVRPCDALLLVLRNFSSPGGAQPNPEKDYWDLEEEMILADLVVAENRIERLERDRKRGKKEQTEEYDLLISCKKILEEGEPIRSDEKLASHPLLKGFTFLSGKPALVILNNEDEDEALPAWHRRPDGVDLMVVRGRLEQDIASLSPDEAEEFIEAYHVTESALDRIIRRSYALLNRISFFTVGPDEVRAWPIPAGTSALDAAGSVHSDIQKGFIRAEVVSFEDLKKYGGFQEAKKAGQVRLEGKEYIIQDGDIAHFRFNA